MKICIKAERITKSYGGRKVLDKLSFTVNCQEVFGLLGPNGAGKSTAIKTVTVLNIILQSLRFLYCS